MKYETVEWVNQNADKVENKKLINKIKKLLGK